MIKVILFDCDGVIIQHAKYFSLRLADQQGRQQLEENQAQKAFFKGIFLDCETGKADLKEVLQKDLSLWNWQGSVEGLMEFWFSGEADVETSLRDAIMELRKKGTKCHITTNNEKYRCQYLWEVAGLKNIFDTLFASSTEGCFKDEQKFWESVYKNFSGIDKSEILVFDDDKENVETAKQFGLNAEFYTNFESFKKIMIENYQL